MIGKIYGNLTVIAKAETRNKKAYWLCRCSCGNTKEIRGQSLKNGHTKSCGCEHYTNCARAHLDGQTFGRLKVIKEHHKANRSVYWLCECECGASVVLSSGRLLSGGTKSCGCLISDTAKITATKHGFYGEPLNAVWNMMKQRCRNPRNKDYKYYGERGITVHEDWLDYLNFREWALNNGYETGLTIDRIDGGKDYAPDNCRWITIQAQQSNKRPRKD